MITYTDILFEGKKPQIDEKVFIARDGSCRARNVL